MSRRSSLLLAAPVLLVGFVAGVAVRTGSLPAWAFPRSCLPGDINGDAARDITDPIVLLEHLFLGGPGPAECVCAPDPTVATSTAIIVRHAEKESAGNDPGLTGEGHERAYRLAEVLRNASIDHLVASELRRTRETLAPLAEARDLPVETLQEASEVVERLRSLAPGTSTVIAHHSFTIHEILEGLGIEDTSGIDVSGDNYDNLLVVIMPPGRPSRLLRLTY